MAQKFDGIDKVASVSPVRQQNFLRFDSAPDGIGAEPEG